MAPVVVTDVTYRLVDILGGAPQIRIEIVDKSHPHGTQYRPLRNENIDIRLTEVQKDKLSPLRPTLPVSGLGTLLNTVTQQAQGTRIMSDAKRCHGLSFDGAPNNAHGRDTGGGNARR